MATHPFKDRPGWKMLIGGELVPGGGAALEVMNPATGEVLGEAPAASETDVSNAVAAAREAYTTWRWTAPEKRGEMLFEIARRIREHHDELVDLETWENGKPRIQSVRDVTNAERTFRFYAGASDKFYGQSVYDSPTEMRKIVYEPYGVVAVIIPWNWPPMHTADFTALALATGNTVVLKPAPETPLSSLRIAELAADVLPPGVLNVVTGGVDTGVQLVAHPGIDFIAFTGSDKTGEKILAAAATRILPTMMELGGKNASILFPDADIDKAVQGMVRSAFFNSGQACSGSERVLVHETIYKTFMERFTSAVAGLVVGEGFDERSIVGPMVSRRQQEKVQGALERATAAGACIPVRSDLPRDERLEGGFWVPPTVITEAAPDAEIMHRHRQRRRLRSHQRRLDPRPGRRPPHGHPHRGRRGGGEPRQHRRAGSPLRRLQAQRRRAQEGLPGGDAQLQPGQGDPDGPLRLSGATDGAGSASVRPRDDAGAGPDGHHGAGASTRRPSPVAASAWRAS
ncbi:MAG: aldehyde dehydrogenase family protein [Deinococcales bacterium]